MRTRRGASPFFISLSEFWLCLAFAAMGAMGTQIRAGEEERAKQLEALRRSEAHETTSPPMVVTLGVSSIEVNGTSLANVSEVRQRVHGPVLIRVGDDVPAGRLKEVLVQLPSAAGVSVATTVD